ncbi:type II toxin-antitoxin system PemK/MazF family toxin [Lapillicoccus sp.]|uniref:type II toxin-antitoxin system PemK/MazF family toxin n=1 Tax=Lapillicoccus sp. TaxID=1909287 RepID=UPI00326794D8
MAQRLGDRIRRALQRVLSPGSAGGSRSAPGSAPGAPRPTAKPGGGTTPRPGSGGVPQPAQSRTYPGDYRGVPAIAYAPKPDGLPDPGEIVWTWVPFEEDHTVGKDRPVLLVGSDGDWLLGVMLTSKDHDRDTPGQRRSGRTWVDIGAGAWDRSGRPSEVRVDRIIRVDAEAIRREGAVLGAAQFDEVADAIRNLH